LAAKMLGFREPGKARPIMPRMPDLSKLQGPNGDRDGTTVRD
jgi:hypothetical protein